MTDVLVLAEIFLFPALDSVVNGLDGGIGFIKSGTDIRGYDFEVLVHAFNCGKQLIFAGTG